MQQQEKSGLSLSSLSATATLASSGGSREESDILARTLRTVAILVGGCVLFVGLLSTAAVVIASKAVEPGVHSASVDSHDVPAKKPLSI